ASRSPPVEGTPRKAPPVLARTMRDVRIAASFGQRAPRRAVLRRLGLVGALALTGVVAQVPVAGADSTLKVPLSAEAWYRPLPIPVEPPPLPPPLPPVAVPEANPY